MSRVNFGFSQAFIPAIVGFTMTSYTMPVRALTGQEVNDISREFTVLIESKGEGSGNGSGAIIARDGDTYYVLTAQHVVKDREYKDGEIKYTIITHDREPHELDYDTVRILPNGTDLAIIEFESDEDYPVATLGNSDLVTEGLPVFVSGWPQPGTVSRDTGGQRIRQFTPGRVSTVLETDFRGYQIGYDNNTFRGMSGGPVVDSNGNVVAIHGQADSIVGSESLVQSSAGVADEEALRQAMTNLGFNYGIPINTFVRGVEEIGLSDLDIEVDDNPPSELSAPYVDDGETDPRDVIDDVGDVLNILERGVRIICIFGGC